MLIAPVAAFLGTLLSPRALVDAKSTPAPLRIDASQEWFGIDGNWSSVSLSVGDPNGQKLRVAVSTSLPEIWVMEEGTCNSSTTCTSARGGLYDIADSQTWSPLGSRGLNHNYPGSQGEGDYGIEAVSISNNEGQTSTTLGQQLVVGLNDTNHANGFLGLGVMTETINGHQVKSPISTLVQDSGLIASHSYGYTAGAYYSNAPLSLTLGGYDESRFVPHNTTFSLNPSSRQPEALLRGIHLSVSELSGTPSVSGSPSIPLSSSNDSVVAVIDSSTPYIWLPSDVCDRFATALNLTWDEDYNLYTYGDDENRQQYLSSNLSFTFSLSSADNRDRSGQPLSGPGVVNITLPAKAFDQTLRYPFMGLIDADAAPVPYFPLRRAPRTGNMVLGRTFLQEAYLITNYETGSFTVSQAQYTPEATPGSPSVINIAASSLSPFPGNPDSSDRHWNKGKVAGVIVGVCLFLIILTTLGWFLRQRKKQRQARSRARSIGPDDLKDDDSIADSYSPRTPVEKIFGKFSDKNSTRKSRKSTAEEQTQASRDLDGGTGDKEHWDFEMPIMGDRIASQTGMEGTIDFRTIGSEITWDEPSSASALYESERQHLEQQTQGRSLNHVSMLPVLEEYGHNESDIRDGVSPDEPGSQWGTYLTSSTQETNYGMSFPPAVSTAYDYLNNHLAPQPPIRTDGTSCNQSEPGMQIQPFNGPPGNLTFPGANSATDAEDPSIYGYGVQNTDRVADLPSTDINSLTFHPPQSNSPRGSPRTSLNLRRHSTQSISTNRRSRSFSIGSTLPPPSPSHQRGTIDGSRVVCLGPLTDNVRLQYESLRSAPASRFQQQMFQQQMMRGSGHAFTLPTVPSGMASRRHSTTESLGSNFTIEEEARERAAGVLSRIDDLIHVPQPSERRFSWEQ